MRSVLSFACTAFVFVLLLAVFSGMCQPPVHGQDQTLENRVAQLERRLADTEALLDETVGYLHTMAKASSSMLEVLDQSQELGFTAGINFKSREVLLAGFRAYWANAMKDVPGVPVEPAEDTKEDKKEPGN